MTSKAAVTYFAKTLAKLDTMISKLEVRTGLTQELLKSGTGIPQVLTQATENQNNNTTTEKPAPAPKQEKAQKPKSEAKPKVETPAKQEEEKQNTQVPLQPEDFAKLDIRVGRITDCWKV